MTMIYVISESADGPCKVGFADEPDKRLRYMQTGNPRSLTLSHALEVGELHRTWESVIHAILGRKSLRGEWFAVTPLEAITAIAEARQIVSDSEERPSPGRLRKLHDADVRAIRVASERNVALADLANRFHVSETAVALVRDRRRKADVPDEGMISPISMLRERQYGPRRYNSKRPYKP